MKLFLIPLLILIPAIGRCEEDSQPSPRGPLVTASPKNPWGDFDVVQEEKPPPVWMQVLDWFPNRIVDFIDIFRVDVGAGIAFGGVVRITKWGQVGYRQMAPLSIRLGPRGRHFPGMVESSNEIGIGPVFLQSKERDVCAGELGIGADLILGGYAGICVDELFDFAAGIFFLDPKNDDPVR